MSIVFGICRELLNRMPRPVFKTYSSDKCEITRYINHSFNAFIINYIIYSYL